MALQILAASAAGAAALVRVGGIDGVEIKRALDAGASGIMAPNVDTVTQAEALVRAVRIPPLGERGAASSTRASRYGFGYPEYLREANGRLVTMVQIESARAVENCEGIAAVDGVDVLFVGPTDLSIDMGVTDDAPAFFAALARVCGAGKAAGILARTVAQAARYREMGFTVIAMESDRGLLAKGFARAVEEFRKTQA